MAEELELKVYELTKQYPPDEKYRSTDQLRRSSSAVTNNIAEAYNKSSSKEKIHILRDIAKSEAEETKRNLSKCGKKGFVPATSSELAEEYTNLIKTISGYIRFLKNSPPKNL